MTMVLCPYEGAGCTFHVSYVMIWRFGIHFVFEIINLANHKGKRLNQVKTQSKYTWSQRKSPLRLWDRVTVGFGLSSDWLRKRRESWRTQTNYSTNQNMKERHVDDAKREQTFGQFGLPFDWLRKWLSPCVVMQNKSNREIHSTLILKLVKALQSRTKITIWVNE